MFFVNFVFGLIFGSAAGAIVHRIPRKISWIHGRSKCDTCKKELGLWDLIPVWSYIRLGGKCRYCHSPIAINNLLIELMTGLGFVFLPGFWLKAIWWVTIIIFFMDLETKLVSEALVVLWGTLVIIGGGASVVGALVGVGIIGGLWAITRGRGMGFGDVEMAVVMGLWLGWPKILVALWVAFVVGGIIGIKGIIWGEKTMKSEIAFGPFLLVGTWVAWGFGSGILRIIGYGF